jgi:large repetitive protein
MRNKISMFWAALTLMAGLSPGQTLPSILPGQTGFSAFVGDAFSQALTCSACDPAAAETWSIGAGSLPAGISLDGTTGVISGTPTAAQVLQFTVGVFQKTALRASRQYAFSTAAHQLIWSTAATLNPATAGLPVSRALQVNLPSLWSLSASTLPPGVSVTVPPNGGTAATLSGTFPAVNSSATYTFQVAASYFPIQLATFSGAFLAAEVIQRNFSITVYPAPVVSPRFAPGEAGAAYRQSLVVAGGAPPLRYFTVPGEGILPPGLALDAVSGAITGTPTRAGTFSFTTGATDVNGATNAVTASITIIGGPAITTGFLPGGQVGVGYSAALAAAGGVPPYTWSLGQGSLPAGFSLNASNGVITGTPAAAGVGRFTARVSDSNNVGATADLTINVVPASLTISGTLLPGATAGTPYAQTFAATGGYPPYTWTVRSGQLPAGLLLSVGGVLAGTPVESAGGQSYSFVVQVTDTGESSAATRQVTLVVAPAPLAITTATLPAGTAGVSYSAPLAAGGGTPPYHWAADSGEIPPGLAIRDDGVISGTPANPSTYSFVARVTDSAGTSAVRGLVIAVNPGVLSITTASLPGGGVGIAYSAALQAAGGTPPYQWSVLDGALPGVSIDPGSGAMGGTPAAAGAYTLAVTVADSRGATASQRYTVTITTLLLDGALPGGVLGSPYSGLVSANGGTPPYAYAVTSGELPAGLILGADGAIAGTPAAAATSTFTIAATDAQKLTGSKSFSITVSVPSLPSVTITKLPDTIAAANQSAFGVLLSQNYPIDLTGVATISFQPLSGPVDPDVRFANGQTTLSFAIAAGNLEGAASAAPMVFSSGTTAGTITIAATLLANGQVVGPDPAFSKTIDVPAAAPVISSVEIVNTAAGINVVASGYSNTREISGITLKFGADASVNFPTSQFDIPPDAFDRWYRGADSANLGGQFLLTVPFNLSEGSASLLKSVTISLTNRAGITTASGGL